MMLFNLLIKTDSEIKIPSSLVSFYVLFLPMQASTDQSAVETQIPYQVAALAFSCIQLLGIIAVMSQVAWQVFIVFIPVIAACIWYQVMSPDSLYVTRSTSVHCISAFIIA
jgi:hypothetical protein